MSRPERAIADLRELAALTGDGAGAQRVAWTDGWQRARAWLESKLAELPVSVDTDAAGNLWATLPGEGDGFVAVGSHLDSVPDGGWLDGALGVVAGLELVRALAETGARPPLSVRLVDWADEEGARFGRSLFGSTAASGTLDVDDLRGVAGLEDALREHGVELSRATAAGRELAGARAYLEMHIEQGPVLERRGLAVAAVDGCAGVERHSIRLVGQAAHAGAAPMDMRRDPLVAAGRAIAEVADLAVAEGATATVGRIAAEPGIVTIVPGAVELTIDLRHPDAAVLARLQERARSTFGQHAADAGVTVEWDPQWRIEPVPFDVELVALARSACQDAGAEPFTMTSGALHDAAAMAPLVPTVMLFVPSIGGISHSAVEDTSEADLATGVLALDSLLARTLEWAVMRASG
ncbi:MAG: beta-ureidopropionase / N-carbamoyl-L-amino-acid hydrolase [Thermoleophilales bacterium]|nr:beta-ureidopropionase / N-carbamoyl-L-amino-acid hydrolase [Thermoleophilales bacterium]